MFFFWWVVLRVAVERGFRPRARGTSDNSPLARARQLGASGSLGSAPARRGVVRENGSARAPIVRRYSPSARIRSAASFIVVAGLWVLGVRVGDEEKRERWRGE